MIFMILGYVHRKKKKTTPSSSKSSKSRKFRMIQKFIFFSWVFSIKDSEWSIGESFESYSLRLMDFIWGWFLNIISIWSIIFDTYLYYKMLIIFRSLHLKPYKTVDAQIPRFSSPVPKTGPGQHGRVQFRLSPKAWLAWALWIWKPIASLTLQTERPKSLLKLFHVPKSLLDKIPWDWGQERLEFLYLIVSVSGE